MNSTLRCTLFLIFKSEFPHWRKSDIGLIIIAWLFRRRGAARAGDIMHNALRLPKTHEPANSHSPFAIHHSRDWLVRNRNLAQHYAQLRYISSRCNPYFVTISAIETALTMTKMMPLADPPSAARAKSPCHRFCATSISDNSRCTHVRRIYAARKAELCLSNINRILATEITTWILHSHSNCTMDLQANTLD